MSKQLLMDVSSAMLLRGEKSLDMLQCLIIYNTWSHYYSLITPYSQSTAKLHLAIAMVFDLGLTKQFREIDTPTEVLVDAMANVPPEFVRRENMRSLEEIRGLLSVYVLKTM
jgi:hypothetical protein